MFPTSSAIPSSEPIPTANPIASPVSLPSNQPSIVQETVTIGGGLSTNQDICSYSVSQLAAFVEATRITIQNIVCSANAEEECNAEISSVCDTQERKLSLYRDLQASPWQMEYEITSTFTCEIAECTSAADTAAVSSISDSVSSSIGNALNSGSFLTLLSTNIDPNSGIDVNILSCIVIWGITEEPVTVIGGGDTMGTGRFYPDWDYQSGTCLEDGNEPVYMAIDESYLLSSLEECCARYYPWDMNGCMNLKGSGLWYADVLNGVCVTDCELGNGNTCGGLADVSSQKIYQNPRSCCESELGWRFVDLCEVS